MPQRLFEDLVTSARTRAARRGARALPFSLAFHAAAVAAAVILPQLAVDLPSVAAAPPPPVPVWAPVRVEVAPQPTPPPTTTVARRAPRSRAAARSSPAAGHGPSVPSDLSRLGDGEVRDDAPALCFTGCSGEGKGSGDGFVVPDAVGSDADPGPPAIRRAGRDVTPPAKLGGAEPVYPELAKRARVGGEVVIECTIDPSGRVVNASVTRSNPLFDTAALDAVRTWRYRPTLVDGIPVPVLLTVTVRFHLR